MLTVTPIAAEAVRELVAAAPVEDTGGIRISVGEETPVGTALQVAIVDSPEAADEAVEEEGARVFLEPAVAEILGDRVLDVEMAGGEPTFALRRHEDERPGEDGRPV